MTRRDWTTLAAAAVLVLAATLAVAGGRTDRLQRRAPSARHDLASQSYREGLAENRFQVSTATLRSWMSGPTPPLLYDLRADSVYQVAHVAGALSAPAEQLLASGPGAAATGRQLVIYDQDGRLAPYVLAPLRAAGYDAYSLAGGYAAWVNAGRAEPKVSGAPEPGAREAAASPPPAAAAPPPAAAVPPPAAAAPPAPASVSPSRPQPAAPAYGQEGC